MERDTRAEHLAWCKSRALEYLKTGDTRNAWASMSSDLNKHEETCNHPSMELGMMLFLGGHLNSVKQMRDFIDGIN